MPAKNPETEIDPLALNDEALELPDPDMDETVETPAPVPSAKASAKAKAAALKKANFKFFRSTEEVAAPYDIQVRGERVLGNFDRMSRRCIWKVPVHLAEVFAASINIRTGRIEACDPPVGRE